MNKKYTNKEMYEKAFELPIKEGLSNGFPTTCAECGNYLKVNDDFDYMSDWTISFTCDTCGQKYAYQPSDMGQSLAWIEAYSNKDKLFDNE